MPVIDWDFVWGIWSVSLSTIVALAPMALLWWLLLRVWDALEVLWRVYIR